MTNTSIKIVQNLLVVFLIFGLLGCTSTPDDKKDAKENETATIELPSKKTPSKEPPPLSTAEPDKMEFDYDVITSGSYSRGVYTAVVRNETQLRKLYANLYGKGKEIPHIDFSKRAIVVVNAGTFNTGGYSIHLKSSKKINNVLKLVFFVKGPGPNELVTMAFTNPYLVIQIAVDKNTEVEVELLGEKGKIAPINALE